MRPVMNTSPLDTFDERTESLSDIGVATEYVSRQSVNYLSSMEELKLGQATISYEGPEGGIIEQTVDNEEIVYARDHWMVRTGTDDEDNDLMKQIPRDRVHRVDRSVEKFEEEAQTVRRRVESIASDLRERLPMDVGGDGQQKRTRTEETGEHGRTIPVEDGDREE